MAIARFLAATWAEIQEKAAGAPQLAFLGCHFSSYGRGLSNLPRALPRGTLLMLDDQMPIGGHDPHLIARQLEDTVHALGCQGVLLDFQRPVTEEAAAMARSLVASLPCPTAVTAAYGHGLSCPVCLPPVPCHVPLKDHLAPWQDREIWLELSTEGEDILLTTQGAKILPPSENSDEGFGDIGLHCHYSLRISEAEARFSLWRTREDLEALEKEAESLGVTKTLGLWQEFYSVDN